jgi:hypothetical protein
VSPRLPGESPYPLIAKEMSKVVGRKWSGRFRWEHGSRQTRSWISPRIGLDKSHASIGFPHVNPMTSVLLCLRCSTVPSNWLRVEHAAFTCGARSPFGEF